MKRIYVYLFVGLVLAILLTLDLTSQQGQYFYNPVAHIFNNRVGIATNFPQNTLDVLGGIRASGLPGSGTNLLIDANGDFFKGSVGGGSGTPAGNNMQLQYNSNSVFGAASGTAWDSTNGFLGIGTNAPSTTLEIFGSNVKFRGPVAGDLYWNSSVTNTPANSHLMLLGAQFIISSNAAGQVGSIYVRDAGEVYVESSLLGETNRFTSVGFGNAHLNRKVDILQGPNNNTDVTWRFGTDRSFGPIASTQDLASLSVPIDQAYFKTVNTVGTGPGTWELYGTNGSSFVTVAANDGGTGVLINTNWGGWTNRVLFSDTQNIETNIAVFDIVATDFVINTWYTNDNRRASLVVSFELDANTTGTAKAGLYIDQAVDGTFETTITVQSTGLTDAVQNVVAGWLQPGARFAITNLSSGAGSPTATVIAGSSQWVKH